MKKYLVYFALLFPIMAQSQQLNLQAAIDTALKNNFDIRIAKKNSEIGKINNTYGVAGGLPTIEGNASDEGALSDVYQKLNSGTINSEDNGTSNSVDAGITASMTLFNGFRIVATKERLSCLQKQSELLLNEQIQNTIGAVMMQYYDIIRQESYLRIIKNSLDVSQKKLDIINERDKVGMANAMDILQAQMDVNSAKQDIKLQQLVVDQDIASLLLLISAKHYTPYKISDTIVVDSTIILDSISNYLVRNPQYLSAEQSVKIDQQIIKETAALRYPSLKMNAGYDYSLTNSSYGTLLTNRINGPSAGLTLQIPIFNGNAYRVKQKTAEFDLANANLEKESLLTTLKSSAITTYLAYSTALKQLQSQKINYQLSNKLVEVVLNNFQVRQATILDVKAAQTTYENASYLLVNLQYSAKVAEIKLKQLVYNLKY